MAELSGFGSSLSARVSSPGSSVKSADSYHSLRSPYLLSVSLPMMTLKPLLSLKRVWPEPGGREEQIVSGDQKKKNLCIAVVSLEVFESPLVSVSQFKLLLAGLQ